jgi:hypothetical protein
MRVSTATASPLDPQPPLDSAFENVAASFSDALARHATSTAASIRAAFDSQLSSEAELLPAAVSFEAAQDEAAGAEDVSVHTRTIAPRLETEVLRVTAMSVRSLSFDSIGIGRSSGGRE